MRAIAKNITTTVQLTKRDEIYSLNTFMVLFETSQKFKPSEPDDVTTQDGRKVEITFTIDGNVLTEKQAGEKTMIIVREFFDKELIVTSSIGNVICKSWCKLVD